TALKLEVQLGAEVAVAGGAVGIRFGRGTIPSSAAHAWVDATSIISNGATATTNRLRTAPPLLPVVTHKAVGGLFVADDRDLAACTGGDHGGCALTWGQQRGRALVGAVEGVRRQVRLLRGRQRGAGRGIVVGHRDMRRRAPGI